MVTANLLIDACCFRLDTAYSRVVGFLERKLCSSFCGYRFPANDPSCLTAARLRSACGGNGRVRMSPVFGGLHARGAPASDQAAE